MTALAHPHSRRSSRRPTASGRVGPWLLVALLVLGLGAVAWTWRAHHPAAGGPGGRAAGMAAGAGRAGGFGGSQPVSVGLAARRDIHVSVSAIGNLVASNTATVHAQVSGVLQKLEFTEGGPVRAGQVLAEIDPRAFQAAADQAAGTLARDQAQLDNARLDLARYRDLRAKDAAPQQQLDTQQALVRQLEGTVKADQGTLASARLQLAYTQVRAPISGRAGLKQVDLGNVVGPSDAAGVVTIAQTRPIALVFAVPSTHLPAITQALRSGQPLPVQAWDREGQQRLALGQVATIDNAIDPSTDTIKVKAIFPNADDALFPNQAVGVRLQLATLAQTLAVPQAAVQRGAQGFYVYVVKPDNTVGARLVRPGAVDGDWMAVAGPLKPGERVVVDGIDRLREGARVEVIAADPNQRAGAAPAPQRPRGQGRAASRAGAASN